MTIVAEKTKRYKITQFISRFPIAIERPKWFNMVNIKPYCPCLFTTGTASITIPSQCFFPLFIPIRAIVRFVSTLKSRMVFGFYPDKLVPALLRAKACFISSAKFPFPSLLKFLPTIFADMKYWRFYSARIFKPYMRFNQMLSPFWGHQHFTSLIGNALTFIRAVFFLWVGREGIKFLTAYQARFNITHFNALIRICLNPFQSFVPRDTACFIGNVIGSYATSSRAVSSFCSFGFKTVPAMRANTIWC